VKIQNAAIAADQQMIVAWHLTRASLAANLPAFAAFAGHDDGAPGRAFRQRRNCTRSVAPF
jgi:hypothetical protein